MVLSGNVPTPYGQLGPCIRGPRLDSLVLKGLASWQQLDLLADDFFKLHDGLSPPVFCSAQPAVPATAGLSCTTMAP